PAPSVGPKVRFERQEALPEDDRFFSRPQSPVRAGGRCGPAETLDRIHDSRRGFAPLPGGVQEAVRWSSIRLTSPATARTRIACPLRRCRFTSLTARDRRNRASACSTTTRRRLNARLYRTSSGGRGFPRGLRRRYAPEACRSRMPV